MARLVGAASRLTLSLSVSVPLLAVSLKGCSELWASVLRFVPSLISLIPEPAKLIMPRRGVLHVGSHKTRANRRRAHRKRQHGQDEGAGGPILRGADSAVAGALCDWQRHYAGGADPGVWDFEEGGGTGEPGFGEAAAGEGASDCACCGRSDCREAQRAFSASGLADGQRHADEHERQRG